MDEKQIEIELKKLDLLERQAKALEGMVTALASIFDELVDIEGSLDYLCKTELPEPLKEG